MAEEIKEGGADRGPHILQMKDQIEEMMILNVQDFIGIIEKIVDEKKIDYFEAVMYYCDKTGLEIESAAEMIKSNAKMKAKIKNDAEQSGYLPKTSRLPI